MPDVTTYRPELLPAIVEFWNRVFADRRNFWNVSEEAFLHRVIRKKTAIEVFRPDGFFIAMEEGKPVGLLHAGRNPESVCRVLNPNWPGGEQGYVALLIVDPDHRRRGVGTALWHASRAFFEDVRQVVVDGQCLNPFYGNSEGPFTPFWGTPEGISVSWSDSQTKKFFAMKGYATRYKAVHMLLDLGKAPAGDAEKLEADLKAKGVELRPTPGAIPTPGTKFGDPVDRGAGTIFDCLCAVEEEKVAAVLTTYPMAELGPGRHAIYEAVVAESHRERGLGRSLLGLAIERLRAQGAQTCDVLTIPEVSEAAYKLYESAGFEVVDRWAIY